MESLNRNSTSKIPDATLSTLRTKNKKLTLFFGVFFVSLFLIIAALIIYLILDISSESQEMISLDLATIHHTPTENPSQDLRLTLLTAYKELRHVINFVDSTSDLNMDPVMKNCSNLLHEAFRQILYGLADQSDQQMSEMTKRIATAERNLNACLHDLEKVESSVGIELRTKVIETSQSVTRSANIAPAIDDRMNFQKHWRSIHWGKIIKAENLFITFVSVMQFSVIGFLFCTVYRFR